MGNCCSKKNKLEPYFEIVETDLKQVIIERMSNCDLCNRQNVFGYDVKSLIENRKIFVCVVCKNLK